MKSQQKGINHAVRKAATLVLTVGMLLIFAGGAASMAGAPSPIARAFPQGQTFNVNSSVDDASAHDSNPGDGRCLDTYGRCTLRAAIEEANAYAGADTITFARAMNIYLDTGQGALPQITEQLKIDASGVWNSSDDQPGVILSCNHGGFRGLRLTADYSEVYGLFVFSCRDAIEIMSAYNTIGGPNPGQRNVLSNNGPNGHGVVIWGSNAHHNVIQSNWIGLSITGDTKGPNWAGVVIFDGAHDNTIGGDTTAKGNYISGNTFPGVMIQDAGSDGNRLGGNMIGLPAVGSLDVGNGTHGVYINTGPQNTKIGNIGVGLMGNTISMNREDGIYIKNANNNWVQENSINSNKLHGVDVDGGAGNQILANTIARNTTYGVYVHETTATGNLILANSIHHNGNKGIRLLAGGNTELAAPAITAASANGASGTACASCMIHVYSDSDGQGETYQGSVNADASGHWIYNGTLSGPNVTATSTDAGNNTSEFSAPKPITGPTPMPIPVSCSDRIQNGGFETGDFSSWTTIGSPWIADYLAHDGIYSGVVGGADNADDTFYQEVVLPSTATSATLTYWWYIYTQAGLGTPMDYLHVEAQDTNGTVLAILATLHDQSPTDGWFQETIDLKNYPSLFGRTIRIAFHGATDGADFTSFYIDEVTLEVCEAKIYMPIMLK